MADDRPIIVTEFEIDKGSINKEFSNLESAAKKSGEKIGSSLSSKGGGGPDFLSGALGAAVGLNQALELAKKVYEAYKAVKDELVNISIEAENIKQVNYQFDVLATRAAGAGNGLKAAFSAAGKGFIDNEELFKAASQALVELGEQAQRLPEIVELARKASFINGQSTIENFNGVVRAIETGSSKSLRSVGIFVDLEKATKAYASSIGVLPEKLTEVELQQLRLNAIMTKGGEAFKGVASVKEVTPAYTKLGVAIKEASEAIYLAINEKVAPSLAALANNSTAQINYFRVAFESVFGHDVSTKRNAEIELLTHNIEYLKAAIAKPNLNTVYDIPQYKDELAASEAKLQNIKDIEKASYDDSRRALLLDTQRLAVLEAQKEKSKETLAEIETLRAKTALPEAAKAKIDELNKRANPLLRFTPEELQKNTVELNSILAKGEDEAINIRLSAANRIQEESLKNQALDEIDAERQVQAEVDLEARIAAIKEQYSLKKGFDQKITNKIIEQETENTQARIIAIEEEGNNRRLARAKAVSDTWKSVITSGLSSALQQVGTNLQQGKGLFEQFGQGIVGIIGDMAIKLGEALIVQALAMQTFIASISTLSPGAAAAAAAAGAGLIIFGAALKASVGLGGGSTTAATGAGPGVADVPGGITQLPADTKQQAPGTKVELNVNGNIIPRDRNFALELTDLVREAFESQGVVAVTT